MLPILPLLSQAQLGGGEA
ncbi:hypothetical protein VCCP10303_2977, partial [Vibrio cholerae CP1030(3)]